MTSAMTYFIKKVGTECNNYFQKKVSNENMANTKDLITVKEAADIHGIYQQLMRYYIKAGICPKPVMIGTHYYFKRKDIENWEKPEFNRGK